MLRVGNKYEIHLFENKSEPHICLFVYLFNFGQVVSVSLFFFFFFF